MTPVLGADLEDRVSSLEEERVEHGNHQIVRLDCACLSCARACVVAVKVHAVSFGAAISYDCVGPVRNPVLQHRACFPWFLSFGNRTKPEALQDDAYMHACPVEGDACMCVSSCHWHGSLSKS